MSIEHWDPHGKYNYKKLSKRLNYKKKMFSVKEDKKVEAPTTIE